MGTNYMMLSGTEMVSSIRKKNVGKIALCVLGILGSVIILIFAGVELRKGEYFYAVLGFIMAVLFFIGLGMGISKAMGTLKNVENCRVFRKYGAPEELAQRISEGSAAPAFESKQALIADSFIMKHGDFESYVPFEDILLIYRKEHRTNGILDSISLVCHDRYGDSFEYPFKLGKKHASDMDIVANMILQKAPDCRTGYTQENLSYVKQNAQQI